MFHDEKIYHVFNEFLFIIKLRRFQNLKEYRILNNKYL